jgi:hypothetical protein
MMRRQILFCAVGLGLALGAANTCAAGVASGAVVRTTSDHNSGPGIHDLGLRAPAANSEDPNPALASASAVSSADATPVPELPIWVMMVLCFAGLGIAVFRRGRRDRLSPGIE